MMNRYRSASVLSVAAVALCLVCAAHSYADTLALFPPPDARVRAGAKVSLPVTVEGAQDLGALQFELIFNEEILEIVEVTPGAGMPPVLLDFHVIRPGLLRVALAGSEPINRDVRIEVLVRGLAVGSGNLDLQSAQAWALSTGFDLLTVTRNGQVTVTGGLPVSNLLIVVMVALLLFAGLGLLLLRKRKGRGHRAGPAGGTGTRPYPPGPPPPPPPAKPQPSPAAKTWYLMRGGEQYGPYDGQMFDAMFREGNVLPDDLVWNETMSEWVRADSVKGFL